LTCKALYLHVNLSRTKKDAAMIVIEHILKRNRRERMHNRGMKVFRVLARALAKHMLHLRK